MTSTINLRMQDANILTQVSQKQLKNAFLLLEGKYEKSVRNTIFKLTKDEQAAEKLTKITFYEVLNTLENCNTISGFSRCVYKTCADLSIEFLRTRKN